MTSLRNETQVEPVIGIIAAAMIIKIIDFLIGTEKADEEPTT